MRNITDKIILCRLRAEGGPGNKANQYNIVYGRTGFDCEYLVKANCEFFYGSQSFDNAIIQHTIRGCISARNH